MDPSISCIKSQLIILLALLEIYITTKETSHINTNKSHTSVVSSCYKTTFTLIKVIFAAFISGLFAGDYCLACLAQFLDWLKIWGHCLQECGYYFPSLYPFLLKYFQPCTDPSYVLLYREIWWSRVLLSYTISTTVSCPLFYTYMKPGCYLKMIGNI